MPDVEASARFAEAHLGFTREMENEGFASLAHPEAGFNLIFLALGLSTFKPAALAGRSADGLLVVFVVDAVDVAHREMVAAGVPMTTEIETEPWGERYFQITDPSGVVYQFVEWVS